MIGIMLLSVIFWLIVGIFTLGLSSLVSGSVTAAFISLIGIRAALSCKKELPRAEWNMLAAYSGIYGILLGIAKMVAVTLALSIAIFLTEWNLGDVKTVFSIEDAEERVQIAFAVQAISLNAILSLIFISLVPAAMAVPMAAAAQSISKGAQGSRLFEGFGSSFLPLLLIFMVYYFFMFFFKIFAVLFLTFPLLLLRAYTSAIALDFSSVPVDELIPVTLAMLAFLWLNAWVWSASALAFRKYNKTAEIQKPKPAEPEVAAQDFRALRKARGQS